MSYDLREVSAKAAIYNLEGTKILMMVYGGGTAHGLPGGHVDKDETPDEAIARELSEELGLRDVELTPATFFVRGPGGAAPHDDKIILGYVARIDEQTPLVFASSEFQEYGVWLDKSSIEKLENLPAGYLSFALENWPSVKKQP